MGWRVPKTPSVSRAGRGAGRRWAQMFSACSLCRLGRGQRKQQRWERSRALREQFHQGGVEAHRAEGNSSARGSLELERSWQPDGGLLVSQGLPVAVPTHSTWSSEPAHTQRYRLGHRTRGSQPVPGARGCSPLSPCFGPTAPWGSQG